MKSLAIIPARSGSKGLKDKNIIDLCGKPMLAYTIEAALVSGEFDEVMVSTDSQFYADIAIQHGASVPFLRDPVFSTDNADSWDVVKVVLKKYQSIGKQYDYVTLLQPTSPLRIADDIIKAFSVLREKDANFVIGVCEVDHSPLWSNVLADDHSLENFINDEVKELRRQDLPQYYRVNGSIYIARVGSLLQNRDIYKEKSFAVVIPKERSIDVDDYMDLKIAETILRSGSHLNQES